MKRRLLTIVVAARPNFMKAAPLIRELDKYSDLFDYHLVHTGQHYDYEMNQGFFDQLGIPEPKINLEVGSGTHAEQTGKIMIAFEKYALNKTPDLVIVFGDVNSTLACSLVASKLHIKVAHVEAGLRSFDMSMPEEINRITTDLISDRLYTPSEDGDQNLMNQGIDKKKIKLVGNIMIDTLMYHYDDCKNLAYFETIGLKKGHYVLVTLHRPSNVDNKAKLHEILRALNDISKKYTVVFSIHPRTKETIERFSLGHYLCFDGVKQKLVNAIGPKSYFEMLNLIMHAKSVITDSGGLQEETTVLGIPCLTLRDNTERPITINQGTNQLVKQTYQDIMDAFHNNLIGDQEKTVPIYWDGKTAQRIVKDLIEWV